MKRSTSLFICLMMLWASMAVAGELVPVGLQKQLFVDDYVIAEKQNVTHELGVVTKYGVVLGSSLPTDYDENDPRNNPASLDFGFMTSVVWNDNDDTSFSLSGCEWHKTSKYGGSEARYSCRRVSVANTLLF